MAALLPLYDVALADPAADELDPRADADLDGFERSLERLLDLAGRQRLDLHRSSLEALAGQYLGFVEETRRFGLELAGDYLVLAASFAYLRSISEGQAGAEPVAPDLTNALASRLRRLETALDAARRFAPSTGVEGPGAASAHPAR